MTDINLEKNCKNCGILKAFNCFTINKKLKDGRCKYCKECEKEKREQNKNKVAEQRKNRREKWKENPVEYTEKTCRICGVLKSLEEYDQNKSLKDGKATCCKKCIQGKPHNPYPQVERKPRKKVEYNLSEKCCNTCGIFKKLDQYTNQITSKDGKRNRCKECAKKLWKENKDKREKIAEKRKETPVKYTEKICKTCKELKPLEHYTNNKRRKDGKENQCKACMKEKNKEKKDKLKEAQKKWRAKNPEYMKQYSKTPKRIEYMKQYANSCDHKRFKQSCKTCKPIDHLSRICRNRILAALKGTKSKHTYEYLGCNYATLRAHLEKQFKEGMTWENQGKWHVDHIIPIQYGNPDFERDYDTIIQRLHYTNLQPLWASENWSKNNRFIG